MMKSNMTVIFAASLLFAAIPAAAGIVAAGYGAKADKPFMVAMDRDGQAKGTDCAHKSDIARHTAVDPVCGMAVKLDNARYEYRYNGRTYYFCRKGDLDKFKENPARYLEK